jgi:hypothetical protein
MCVGYDFKFKKHLACSLRATQSLSSLSESANKCKAVTRNDNAMSKDEDEGRGEDSESSGPPFPSTNELQRGRRSS